MTEKLQENANIRDSFSVEDVEVSNYLTTTVPSETCQFQKKIAFMSKDITMYILQHL